MQLLKKINNNYAMALDSQGVQIIVEGRGVGFMKMPCELDDLSRIRRTYYSTDEQDVALIQSVPEEVLLTCERIYDYALRVVQAELNPNLPFILADHIQFCIERQEKNMKMSFPLYYDIELLYPNESKVAQFALKAVLEDLGILLPEKEKAGIAMNIINSELQVAENDGDYSELIRLCTSVIERSMGREIERDGFEYSRFVTHLVYLFRRGRQNALVAEKDTDLYETVNAEYPDIKRCVDMIETVLQRKQFPLNREEKLYLMMHINRLCSREDSYR